MPFSPKPQTISSTRPCGLSDRHTMTLGGIRFVPDLSGALFAPELGALLVADLHLEQGASLARRGIAVPPYDTGATLDALESVLAETRAKTLYLLGDSFHDAVAHLAIEEDILSRLTALTSRIETIWISGNHDPAPKPNLGGAHVAQAQLGAITLRHEPRPLPKDDLEIAGHLHPGAGIAQRGHMVRGKCFVHDRRRIILPAFGSYTGGLSIHSQPFRHLIAVETAQVFMLARGKVHRFAYRRTC